VKLQPTSEEIAAYLEEMNPEALMYEGFEDALVGFASRCSTQPLALYDRGKCIDILVDSGMSPEDAEEYFAYNVEGCWAGPNTPLIAAFCLEPIGLRYPISNLELITETGGDVEVYVGRHTGPESVADSADTGSGGVNGASESGGPVGSSKQT
tara:strand:+ start:1308 stop:1766 length:459 start_codon:yes stop_codon:yes gene_type:complete